MGSEARPARLQTEPAASSSSARVGDTEAADIPSSAGSYELHVLPQKATSIAAADKSPHDESDGIALPAQSPPDPDKKEMSRTPLLVRSSPAQGTGSYGGLPVLSLSSSPDDSDHHVTSLYQRTKGKGKGKSKLRHSESAQHRDSLNRSHDDSIRSEPVFAPSRARRRSTRDDDSDSTPLEEALRGQAESGLESRFNASSLAPSGLRAPRVFESLQSSSTSSQAEEADVDDDDETSEGEAMPDTKTNGHPSDNSPYAQVRASVAATDDTSLSINTPRMWSLSLLFAILGSSTNLFFSLRYPSVSITPIIALLLVHPLGLLWDQILKRSDDPDETFVHGTLQSDNSRPASRRSPYPSNPPWKRRFRLWLAQGRWNAKEHCCVYISSNVSFGFAFATDVSMMSKLVGEMLT